MLFMPRFLYAGVGLFVIAVAFGLPYISLLGLEFSAIPQTTLVVMQVGLVIAGLGLMMEGDN